jgi:two-component system sensor histidine kinase PilS (NtrC family)
VQVAPLLRELAEMCRAACPAGVRVGVEVAAGDALRVHADAKQLRQVLWNLVLNAAQAMGERGEIRLAAAATERALPQGADAEARSGAASGRGAVEISVADDGPGVAPEALERIFDPFFTTKPSGTGLGLATVHRIVTSHGGSIAVETAKGGGACFRVVLPASEAPR